MKQFFKFMFASALGTFISIMLASILSMVIFFAMLSGIISSASIDKKKVTKVENNSVLHIKLNNPIQDRTSDNPFENFDFNTFEPANNLGLDQILKNIEKAKGPFSNK